MLLENIRWGYFYYEVAYVGVFLFLGKMSSIIGWRNGQSFSTKRMLFMNSGLLFIDILLLCYRRRSSGSVIRASAPWAGGRGFDPRPLHTKEVIKMVPDASLLSAQHIRTDLASLSSQTSFKNRRWMPSAMSG